MDGLFVLCGCVLKTFCELKHRSLSQLVLFWVVHLVNILVFGCEFQEYTALKCCRCVVHVRCGVLTP